MGPPYTPQVPHPRLLLQLHAREGTRLSPDQCVVPEGSDHLAKPTLTCRELTTQGPVEAFEEVSAENTRAGQPARLIHGGGEAGGEGNRPHQKANASPQGTSVQTTCLLGSGSHLVWGPDECVTPMGIRRQAH